MSLEQVIIPANTCAIDPATSEAAWQQAVSEAEHLAPDFYRTEEGVLTAIGIGHIIAERCFSDPLRDTARSFTAAGNEQGALLLQGLPQPVELADKRPQPEGLTDVYSRAYGLVAVAVTTLFGPPVGYRVPQGVTAFLTQVTPDEQTGPIVSSSRAGGWHAEFAATPNRPAVMVLSCARSGQAQTALMPTNRVLERLSPDTSAQLRQPGYITPDGFIRDDKHKGPLLVDISGQPALVLGECYPDYQYGNDAKSLEAMATLYTVLDNPSLTVEHQLQAGEALAVHNRTCLHARSEITPEPGQQPRWLMRTFAGEEWMQTVVDDVWQTSDR